MTEKEALRLKNLWTLEDALYDDGCTCVAGVDEAGRGPLAGPVVAACVILPRGVLIPGLNDSKKVPEAKREQLYAIITSEAVCYNTARVESDVIDDINILNATHRAMIEAVAGMAIQPDHVLIDGRPISGAGFAYTAVVGGDGMSTSVAAASIVAKVTRDRLMRKYALTYSEYGFAKHKGYGTAEHIAAIRRHGPCPIHRRTFIKNFL